ncbi:hypothetical periplasmic protein [Photobacterium aphoticum]|uniref:Hypothetical periplasmic protein n=1 Tax=Photobacterium aphoticum TaxID=754436 RepID=A0A090QKW6_9GAMM|nr:hypothetical periplasmic protein [Photobacterium aphoticum]
MFTSITHTMNKSGASRHAMLTLSLLVLLSVLALPAQASSVTSSWQSWPAVGDATLKWGPWVIYDSELRSPSGRYLSQDHDLALVIKYRRNIDKDDLIDATDDQWQHLGISKAKRDKWLRTLSQIWPDVKKGDRLIYVLQNDQGRFYRDNRQIGVVQDREMSQSFLHIWLSPKTSYPQIRQQLIGMR